MFFIMTVSFGSICWLCQRWVKGSWAFVERFCFDYCSIKLLIG